MRILRPLFLFTALWLAAAQGAFASPFQRLSEGPLSPEQAFRYEVIPGAGGQVQIRWTIAPGYYLYRDKFTARESRGRDLSLQMPAGEIREDLTFGAVEVYPRDMTLGLSGAYGPVTLGWQDCQDNGICYAPQSAVIALPGAVAVPAPEAAPLTEVEVLRSEGGIPWVLAGFAGLGLLLSFTPCSFPMLPVLWAMLGGAPAGSRRAVGIAVFYVAGMAAGFALIGALAGFMGAGLQFRLQQPLVILSVAALFAVLAAASLDLIPLKMPAAVTRRLQSLGGRGSLTGAGFAGLASVLILGPCVTAPLAGALLYIAQSGDVALGAAALAMLGLGQGLPLMALALFGRKMLPKSGAWLGASRIALAALLAGMAVWLSARVLPGPVGLFLWALLGFALAAAAWGPGRPRRFGGVVFFAFGLLQLAGAGSGGSDPLRPLVFAPAVAPAAPSQVVRSQADLRSALARAEGPARAVYVTADWCVICKALERDVFPQPAVQQALAALPFLKADVTDFSGEGGALAEALGVIGPPTLVFLDERGQEESALRLTGGFTAEALTDALRKAGE